MSMQRLFGAFFLALALLVGQQAAALHDLSHATEQIDSKAPAPAKHVCDQCFLGAQLSGAVGSHVASLPFVASGHVEALPQRDTVDLPAARIYFRSRAPPAFP